MNPSTYKEFTDTYGKRPTDIVFAVARKDALEDVADYLDKYRDKFHLRMDYDTFMDLGADAYKLRKGLMPQI